ncbi:hypothetical protein E4U09_000326 [Claviceps aff. purpurea]|uniref:Uncharacterized protein n=1 Tax=Claviceps aff. purpurea TaxID=1967640 RepID=A0A9P7QDS0_9HYPO|nr:hypothetical protein E4U11_004784 [Claviceps purpurea]KAG6283261.1 hypothetical protein E4U09_000326 [Claviceps aff. purpurea]
MLVHTLSAVLFAALVGAAPQHQLEARTLSMATCRIICAKDCASDATRLQCLACVATCTSTADDGGPVDPK